MRRKISIALGALIVILVGLWFWPSPAPNRALVDPALLRLVPPFTTFETSYYMDGGSIGVRLVDSKGQTQAFALPVDDKRTYPRLFVGAPHTDDPGAVEIPFSTDTRRMLISWIEANGSSADSSDHALFYLRGNLRDYVRLSVHAATSLSKRLLQ